MRGEIWPRAGPAAGFAERAASALGYPVLTAKASFRAVAHRLARSHPAKIDGLQARALPSRIARTPRSFEGAMKLSRMRRSHRLRALCRPLGQGILTRWPAPRADRARQRRLTSAAIIVNEKLRFFKAAISDLLQGWVRDQ